MGNQLSKLREKYEELYKKKFEDINKIIKQFNNNNKKDIINDIQLTNIQNIKPENSSFNFNLDDDNNILSKTYIFPKNNHININNIEEQKKFNNIDNNNNNRNLINNQTHQEPIYKSNNDANLMMNNIKGNNNYINHVMHTPGGEDENKTIFNNNGEYSFDCTNAMYLTFYIYEGTKEKTVEILLKNNGNKTWPKNALFKLDKSSNLLIDDIILSQQKPGEEKNYFAVFRNLDTYTSGQYQANFIFYFNGEIYGEKLPVKIIIKNKNKENTELEKYKDIIKDFRDTFSLDKDEYPDDKLYEILKDNNFNQEASFSAMFN